MENEKCVTVIVVNWNSRDLLRECLFSLRRQTYRNFHVIVVDNGSIDGSLEMLENEFGGFAYLIKNSRNHGFCRAVNQAICASKSDYVALLNNDAEAQPTWLEEMATAIGRAENIGMCASKILKHDQPEVIDKVGTSSISTVRIEAGERARPTVGSSTRKRKRFSRMDARHSIAALSLTPWVCLMRISLPTAMMLNWGCARGSAVGLPSTLRGPLYTIGIRRPSGPIRRRRFSTWSETGCGWP